MVFFNAVSGVEFFRPGTDMVNLAFLPLFHIAGLNTLANPAYHQSNVSWSMLCIGPKSAYPCTSVISANLAIMPPKVAAASSRSFGKQSTSKSRK